MTPHQLREHFAQVEQSVSRAAIACERAARVSGAVRHEVAEWSHACQLARATVDHEGDPDRIRACLDALETSGRRTLEVCRAGEADGSLEQAVAHACSMIGELRHGLA